MKIKIPDQPFVFKNFQIYHHNCAHKVGFDGVLLGAWVDVGHDYHICDLGAGSGLISLMIAQRFSNTKIIAIEIDESSFQQAKFNIEKSIYKNHIQLIQNDFLDYKSTIAFDHIICNPPFYVNKNKIINHARLIARHSNNELLNALFKKSCDVLNDNGKFSLIYPYEFKNEFEINLESNGLFKSKECLVFTGKDTPERILSTWQKQLNTITYSQLNIYQKDQTYSQDYINLTKDFYINL